MAICGKENINLFFKYLRGELSREEEHLIDSHVQDCQDCLLNFAYVEEIVTQKQKLSTDEKTLLLRYLSDSLYQEHLDKLKQEILSEIRDIQKQELQEELLNQINIFNQDNGLPSNIIPINKKSESIEAIDSKDFKTSNKMADLSNHTFYLRKYATAALILTFLTLSTSVYLVLDKHYQISSIAPALVTSKATAESIQGNSTSTISTSINLYQNLDLAIDSYLEHQNITYIKKAEEIAKEIEAKYGDKYGVDLVAYYKSAPVQVIEKLLTSRKKLTQLTNQATGDDYKQRLEASQALEKELLSLGNLVEAYKTKALLNKLYVQLHNNQIASTITQEGIEFSTSHKYLLLQADFLLWQAKRFSEIPDFTKAEKSFLQVIELGNKLNINKLVNSAGTSLAFLYYNQDDNKKAFELTTKLLQPITDYKSTQSITLLQLAGLSSFNLQYYEISDFYLKEAVRNSEEFANPVFISRSYVFLALILSEQKKFDEANNLYSKAESQINDIKDETARLEALAWLTGYKAKLRLLENNYDQAIKLYQNKLLLMDKIHFANNLEISQSHEGIAIALNALGQKEKSQEHSTIARTHKILADNNNQTANCLLFLIPTSCTLER